MLCGLKQLPLTCLKTIKNQLQSKWVVCILLGQVVCMLPIIPWL